MTITSLVHKAANSMRYVVYEQEGSIIKHKIYMLGLFDKALIDFKRVY